jgi:hypothetical protein
MSSTWSLLVALPEGENLNNSEKLYQRDNLTSRKAFPEEQLFQKDNLTRDFTTGEIYAGGF